MKTRKNELGDKNIIGAQVTKIRGIRDLKQKDFITLMQIAEADINPMSVSKLEGQTRKVTDKELFIISKVLHVPIADLFPDFNDPTWRSSFE